MFLIIAESAPMMLYLFRDRYVRPALRNEYTQANDNVSRILGHQEIVVTENHIRLLPGLIEANAFKRCG